MQRCEWFALCLNEATGVTPHPTLGEVPTCDRCHAFATDTASASRNATAIALQAPHLLAAPLEAVAHDV